FDHELHQKKVVGCVVCHHYSGNEFPPCNECHGASFDPANLNKPGIAHVYHLRCISCHKENQKGPVECTGCHTRAAIPPLSISHPLAGRGNCLSCHGAVIPGVPGLPADHGNGVTNGQCELCHKAKVEEAVASNKLPHKVAGHEDCLMRHGEEIGGITKVPADHAGRTNDTCQLCHIY
ncbi:MAG: cytochrome c3 family protein, partial [Dehalococcoidia bacterium]|nr:cytochrome c3 family protein [Dehalococcoidia bacterium]